MKKSICGIRNCHLRSPTTYAPQLQRGLYENTMQVERNAGSNTIPFVGEGRAKKRHEMGHTEIACDGDSHRMAILF